MKCFIAAISKIARATALGVSYASPVHTAAAAARGNSAIIIDGKSAAYEIKQEVAKQVELMKASAGLVPGLAVIFAGNRKSSELYVNHKTIACAETGIVSSCTKLPEDVSEQQLLDVIGRYNEDPSIHGILVQLPIPQHLNEDRILSSIKLEKDVDGCHPLNIGKLALKENQPLFIPCTAKACLHLLLDRQVEISGKYAVVIGCGSIAGLPISLLLQHHNATVTRVHAFTKSPECYTRNADIVISAAGCPNLVRGNWLKPKSIVLDVGINHIPDKSGELQLVGDVCLSEAREVASMISPVPGGVGPVTIAMLLQNTLTAARVIHGL